MIEASQQAKEKLLSLMKEGVKKQYLLELE